MNLPISIWTNYFDEFVPEERIKMIKSCGFDFAELSTEEGDTLLSRGNIKKTAKEFRTFIDGEGVTVLQGHLKLFCNICQPNNQPVLDELKKWIELYSSIGIKNMVLHCGYVDNKTDEELMPVRVAALKQLLAEIENGPSSICLENLIVTATTSQSLINIINEVKSKNLAICLDTGHLNIQNGIESQYDFIKNAGSHLKALHITDNEGLFDQHLLPYSIGKDDSPDKHCHRINFEEVMKGLSEINYNGYFNFEIPGESVCPTPVKIAKLKYAKTMAEYLLSLY